MSKAFCYKWAANQEIDKQNWVLGQLTVPPGNYIINCKAKALLYKPDSNAEHFTRALECKLAAGGEEDSLLINLHSDTTEGDNIRLIVLNIYGSVTDGKVQFKCYTSTPGLLRISQLTISAIQIDDLELHEEEPSHFNPYKGHTSPTYGGSTDVGDVFDRGARFPR